MTMKVHFIAAGGPLMHTRADIPDRTSDKLRIAVAGSHGKTTTAAMIMHVFKHNNIPFDYLAGSATDSDETLAGPGSDSRKGVTEADKSLNPPIDPGPEFHIYKPHIAVINCVTGDHMNAFPGPENCGEQYSVFASAIMPGGSLLYYVDDPQAVEIAAHCRDDIRKVPYDVHGYMVNKTGCYAVTINRMVKVGFSEAHNMLNLSAAREVCLAAGLTEDQFYTAIGSFAGASKNLKNSLLIQ